MESTSTNSNFLLQKSYSNGDVIGDYCTTTITGPAQVRFHTIVIIIIITFCFISMPVVLSIFFLVRISVIMIVFLFIFG